MKENKNRYLPREEDIIIIDNTIEIEMENNNNNIHATNSKSPNSIGNDPDAFKTYVPTSSNTMNYYETKEYVMDKRHNNLKDDTKKKMYYHHPIATSKFEKEKTLNNNNDPTKSPYLYYPTNYPSIIATTSNSINNIDAFYDNTVYDHDNDNDIGTSSPLNASIIIILSIFILSTLVFLYHHYIDNHDINNDSDNDIDIPVIITEGLHNTSTTSTTIQLLGLDGNASNNNNDGEEINFLNRSSSIKQLKLKSYSTYLEEETENRNNDIEECCSICLAEYDDTDIISQSYNEQCSHIFHKDCILEWLLKKHNDCPCCRYPYIHNNNNISRSSLLSSNSSSSNPSSSARLAMYNTTDRNNAHDNTTHEMQSLREFVQHEIILRRGRNASLSNRGILQQLQRVNAIIPQVTTTTTTEDGHQRRQSTSSQEQNNNEVSNAENNHENDEGNNNDNNAIVNITQSESNVIMTLLPNPNSTQRITLQNAPSSHPLQHDNDANNGNGIEDDEEEYHTSNIITDDDDDDDSINNNNEANHDSDSNNGNNINNAISANDHNESISNNSMIEHDSESETNVSQADAGNDDDEITSQ